MARRAGADDADRLQVFIRNGPLRAGGKGMKDQRAAGGQESGERITVPWMPAV